MSTTLSPLGIVHTLISVISIISGAVALVRYRRITLATLSGKTYLVTMLITCLTSFGIFSKGVWTPGHTLTIISLLVLAVGVFGDLRGRANVRDIAMSISYFLLWFFTVTEAFTRLPVGQPIAADQNAPIINAARLVLLIVTMLGALMQVRRNRLAS
jgi:uncharacterized membrane protein